MEYIVSQLFNGIILGLLYALIALGLTLILGVMEVINFVHAALFTFGAYLSLVLTGYIGFWPSLIIAPLLVGLIGILYETLTFRRVYGKDPLFGLLLAFGLVLASTEVIRMIWGPTGYALNPPRELVGSINLGFMLYSKYRIFAGLFTLVLIFLMWAFLEKTTYGMVIKAGVSDSEMIGALGKNLPKVRTLVYSIGSIFAGIAGVLLAPLQGVKPDMGMAIIMPAFVVIVVGGVGSFLGTIIGSLLVGLTVTIVVMVAPRISDLAMYVILAIIILKRPRGLMGEKSGLEA
jgi:branched-chain amino acid transport system permease protein